MTGLDLQIAGVVLAAVTFASIAVGHVLVRRLQARYGTKPALPFFMMGILGLLGSVLAGRDLLSGVLGIIAITLIWDGVEIYRQEKRMQRDRETQSGAG